ncbi:SnoaL-like polyketide cyclase [Gimesia panareensis]|uniref:SnoaL-like polyketide cyclase n=1 Tax=Gimesia panareensis TaxID=2527978 RepID=A0A517Q6Z0_9PLAN|nr:ester cyclase [Gimesia panareensis]QDT27373.1 SnoaL-like polyketide cyclase [Gimesia panareensis]
MYEFDVERLTPEQWAMVVLWEAHLAAEFETKDADASCGTMTDVPYVNHVPTITGGVGHRQLNHFYDRYFIPNMPDDLEMEMITRTVGLDRIVDEFVIRCTHSVEMYWLLPGVPPTGRRLEFVVVVIVCFEEGKMSEEHIHWDQASVLVQAGLLDPEHLPVVGAEGARKMLDRNAVPSNLLIKRGVEDELL